MRKLVLRLCYPGLTIGRGVVIEPSALVHVVGEGVLTIGDGSYIGSYAHILASKGQLTIGANCFVGRGSVIAAQTTISIGEDCLIAEYVTIRDQDHATADTRLPFRLQGFTTAPISVGRGVWLGAKVTVLKGVTIGDRAIVGANSVVTRPVTAGATVAGAPARLIGQREIAVARVR